jgi:hypothetical protein
MVRLRMQFGSPFIAGPDRLHRILQRAACSFRLTALQRRQLRQLVRPLLGVLALFRSSQRGLAWRP